MAGETYDEVKQKKKPTKTARRGMGPNLMGFNQWECSVLGDFILELEGKGSLKQTSLQMTKVNAGRKRLGIVGGKGYM